jgi:hypothetical protein
MKREAVTGAFALLLSLIVFSSFAPSLSAQTLRTVPVGIAGFRIPLKSASDSEANRPALWSKAAGDRSAATLEILS